MHKPKIRRLSFLLSGLLAIVGFMPQLAQAYSTGDATVAVANPFLQINLTRATGSEMSSFSINAIITDGSGHTATANLVVENGQSTTDSPSGALTFTAPTNAGDPDIIGIFTDSFIDDAAATGANNIAIAAADVVTVTITEGTTSGAKHTMTLANGSTDDGRTDAVTMNLPRLEVAGTTGLEGTAGTALTALTVTAYDIYGEAASGYVVTGAASNNGSLAGATTATDGTASVTWTLGTSVGAQTLTLAATKTDSVDLSSSEISATAQANSALVTTLTVTSGDAQSGTVGTALANAFTVTATDGANAIEGVPVTFVVATGGGSVSAATANTNANGEASTTLTLGTATGANTVTASVAGSSASDLTLTGTGTADAASMLSVAVSQSTASSVTATDVTVTATLQDQHGNTVTTDGVTVTFAVTDNTNADFATATADTTSGVASQTLTTVANDSTATVNITADATGMTQGTATLNTIPFSIDVTAASVLAGGTQALVLTGGDTSTTWNVDPDTATLTNTSATGATFNAPASVTTPTVYTVTVTPGTGTPITSMITVYSDVSMTDSDGNTIANDGTISSTAGTATAITLAGGKTDGTTVMLTAPGGTAAACAGDTCGFANNVLTITPGTTGAFAGEWMATITSDMGNGTTTSKTVKISVPMMVSVDKTSIPNMAVTGETTSAATVTVKGAAENDTILFSVLDSAGEISTIVASATANSTATSDGAGVAGVTNSTYVATSTVTGMDTVESRTTFTVKVSNNTQTALAAVSTPSMAVFPTVTYLGGVVEATDNTTDISGALVTVSNYVNSLQQPVSVTTDAHGDFNIVLPSQGSTDYDFVATKTGYIAKSFNGTGYKSSTTEASVSLTSASFTLTGSITNLPADAGATITGVTETGSSVGTPVVVTGATTGNTSYSISFAATDTTVMGVAIAADGFDTHTILAQAVHEADATLADATLAVTVNYSTAVAAGPIFTITSSVDSGTVPDMSAFTVETLSDATVTAPTVNCVAASCTVTYTDDEAMTVVLKSGTDVVYTYDYTKTTGSSVDANQAQGALSLGVTGSVISGTTAQFDATGTNQVIDTVNVTIPAGGINTTAVTGTIKSATVNVQTISITDDATNTSATEAAATYASGTGGKVVEVTLDVITDDGAGTLSRVTSDMIDAITITIPYDPTVVDPTDLENGTLSVNQANSAADFMNKVGYRSFSGSALTVNQINNTVTFTTDHLSVFGIGAALVASGSGGGGGFGPLALLALVPLAFWVRRKLR